MLVLCDETQQWYRQIFSDTSHHSINIISCIRPLSMPSPPLASSPQHSPNSMSPRSLSPNPQLSPKHNVRPSSCFTPQNHPGKNSLLKNFLPSPPSSPSTLSPCSSNSLPSSQASHNNFLHQSNSTATSCCQHWIFCLVKVMPILICWFSAEVVMDVMDVALIRVEWSMQIWWSSSSKNLGLRNQSSHKQQQ